LGGAVVGHPGRVRRTGLLIASWGLATVLALVLGLQSVSAISNSVTNHRKASLSPASVKAALNRSSSASGSSSESTDSSASASSSESTSSRPPGNASSSSDDGGVGPTVPGVVDDHGGNPAADSSSHGDGASSDSSSRELDSSGGSPPASSRQDRTYQLVGGSVGVHFENGAAHLLWATPATGFSVESRGHGSEVDVRFRSDSHESRLRAFWETGPQQEIEEDDH
jgi:cytoskeletal protein RodZ